MNILTKIRRYVFLIFFFFILIIIRPWPYNYKGDGSLKEKYYNRFINEYSLEFKEVQLNRKELMLEYNIFCLPNKIFYMQIDFKSPYEMDISDYNKLFFDIKLLNFNNQNLISGYTGRLFKSNERGVFLSTSNVYFGGTGFKPNEFGSIFTFQNMNIYPSTNIKSFIPFTQCSKYILKVSINQDNLTEKVSLKIRYKTDSLFDF